MFCFLCVRSVSCAYVFVLSIHVSLFGFHLRLIKSSLEQIYETEHENESLFP
jgi:hypothetical protein